ncbi:MAG: amidohydrolase [Acidobacteriota bacterium]|nr:amidohydrolase [Acidobacteriota bacterium]MDH3529295.1 amidohydrolase [Acidobacteriota bacterium]
MRFIFFALFVLLTGLSCSQNNPNESRDEQKAVDRLFKNGRIYTANKKQPWAEAVFVENGVIKFVGSNAEAANAASEGAEVVDLQGRMMMPGIHDVHAHPLEAMSAIAGACTLSPDETDAENFVEVLDECQDDQVATNWVIGSGHSVSTLLEAERLPVEILDDAVPDRPALMMEETSHSTWVNSKALELAKIDKDTPNPPGGVIVKDKETGQPTGVMFDSAGDLVMDLAWLPTNEIKQLNYEGLIQAVRQLNKNGITSVTEGRTYWKRGFQEAWFRAEKEGKLNVRAALALWAYPSMDDDKQIQKLKSLVKKRTNGLVNVSQIKIYSDGILVNSTAAMLEPYKESVGEIPSNNGLNYFTEDRIAKYIEALEPSGFDFLIHAIGDRGVRESLNAIEKAQKGKGRHRLTHLEVVDPSDYGRFKLLDVTADVQVAGDFTKPENWKEMEPLIGERSNNLVPLKGLFDAGARITLSSDWDVSPLNPFIGMQNAMTRAPQNLTSLDEVIRAYTLTPAYTMRQEDITGSIEAGKLADLIVIDRDIFKIPHDKISETTVLMTFLGGRKVYEKP